MQKIRNINVKAILIMIIFDLILLKNISLIDLCINIKKATDYDLDKIYFCIWFSCQEKCKCEYLDMAIKCKQMAEYLDCPDSMY